MKAIQHSWLMEIYKSFEIMKYKQHTQLTEYYRIYQNGEPASHVIAGSIKGAKNIIDSHFKHTA